MMPANEARKLLNYNMNQEVFDLNSPLISYYGVVLAYDNPDFIPHLQTEYCYVIVHPGSGRHHATPEKWEKYGSYSDYFQNLTSLIKRLGNSLELSLFYFDEVAFEHRAPVEVWPSNFTPRNLILITEEANLKFQNSLQTTSYRKVDLHQEKIIPFLKDIGVKKIFLAGEWVWHEEERYRKGGCLEAMAENLQDYFEVEFVEGCVYPSKPFPGSEKK